MIKCKKCGVENQSNYCPDCDPFVYTIGEQNTNRVDAFCGDPTCIVCKKSGYNNVKPRNYAKALNSDLDVLRAKGTVNGDTRRPVGPAQPAFSAAPKFSPIRLLDFLENKLKKISFEKQLMAQTYPRTTNLFLKIIVGLLTGLTLVLLIKFWATAGVFLIGLILGAFVTLIAMTIEQDF